MFKHFSKLSLAILLASSLVAFKFIDKLNWSSDAVHSRMGFTINHFGISEVYGDFKTYDAKLSYTKADLTDATVELTADVKSVNTGNEMRDGHLKGPDFFDAEKYPNLTFKSTAFKKKDAKNYKVEGNLTMHGVTKPVVLDVIYNGTATIQKTEKLGFRITGVVKRSDFNFGSSMPAPMLSNEVQLISDMEFSKN